ncbi:MAG: hypothetical protein ABI462_03790 [Ignavibacteria bacterium]
MIKEIQESLSRAQLNLKNLRKTNSRFIYISLIASVLATLLAGLTAFTGPIAGQGAPAWKWTCGIVAIFTATATVFTGLQKQFTVSERLAKATECVGKLKSVLIGMENAEENSADKKEFVNEYKKIAETYSEYIL